MAQGIGSLAGAIRTGTDIYQGIQQGRRQDEQAQRQQEEHDLAQKQRAFTLEESQRAAQQKALYTTVHMGEKLGWNNPMVQAEVKRLGAPYGIGGATMRPDGTVVYLDPQGQPFRTPVQGEQALEPGAADEMGRPLERGPMGNELALTRDQRDDIMRQLEFGQRQSVDLGDRTATDYPTERLGDERKKGAPPKAPLDDIELRLQEAQIENLQAQAHKNAKEASRTGKYGWEDFERFVGNLIRPNSMGDLPLHAPQVLDAKGEAMRRANGDPVKAAELFSELMIERGDSPGGAPPPPALIRKYGGTQLPPPGQPQPQPGAPEPPPASPPEPAESPRASALRADMQRLKGMQGNADIDTARDLNEQERSMAEQLREEVERPQQLTEIRKIIDETRAIPGTGDLTVANRALRIWKGTIQGQIGSGVNRLFGGTEQPGLEFLTIEDVNAALAEAGVAARIDDVGQGQYAVRAVNAAPVVGAPQKPAPGARRGGVVRAPYGGAVDGLTGTDVPAGILTRVRNLSSATGAQGVGAGIPVRLTQGREF